MSGLEDGALLFLKMAKSSATGAFTPYSSRCILQDWGPLYSEPF